MRPNVCVSTARPITPRRPCGPLRSLEARLDPLSLWRVATWEYDRSTDFVCWFDSPADVLNLSEASADQLVEPVIVSLRSGAPWEHYDLDRNLVDRDGVPVDLRVRARCLRDESGQVSGGIGLVTDISEQRRNEAALRGMIDRYRKLVELSPDPVIVHQGGVIRYASPAAVRVAGVDDVTDLLGRGILDFVHPSSLEDTLQRIGALQEPGQVSEPTEAILMRQDGSPTVVESISVRIDWEGEPAFQVILRDATERRRAEAATRYQASLVSHVSDAIIATDQSGGLRSWNPAAEVLYGVQSADAIGRSAAELLGPQAVEADGLPKAGEVEHDRADGRSIPVLVSVGPVRDEFGELDGTVAVCTDLTERLERQAAEARYAAAVAALDEGVIVVDRDGTVVSVNSSARAMLGQGLHDSEGRGAIAFGRRPMVTEDGRPLSPENHPLAVGLRTGEPQSRVVIGVLGDNAETRWYSVSVQPLREHADRAGALVCSFSDITERKNVEEQLSFQATHDSLTYLPNRDLLLGAIADEPRRGARVGDERRGAADRPGPVQDHQRRVRARHRGQRPEGGGGPPGGVLPGGRRARPAGRRRVRHGVPGPRVAGGGRDAGPPGRRRGERPAAAAVGPGAGGDGQRRGGVPEGRAGHPRGGALPRRRRDVPGEGAGPGPDRGVRRGAAVGGGPPAADPRGAAGAVDAREITAAYQPIVDATTGLMVGVEVLARWEHRTLGDISPAEFIPVAEDTGLAVPLGSHILQTACTDLARWQRERQVGDDFTMHVNLSPRQLADPDLPETVAEILSAAGVAANQLWLEVTESVFMEDANFILTALADLKAMGIHFAIDDFGTGYSSLAYLKRFPVEALKIDKSFVDGLGDDPESDAIVAAIIGLAHTLHLRTVAEGVETPEQLEQLRALGCELLQGFLMSRPIPAHCIPFRQRLVAQPLRAPAGSAPHRTNARLSLSALPGPAAIRRGRTGTPCRVRSGSSGAGTAPARACAGRGP